MPRSSLHSQAWPGLAAPDLLKSHSPKASSEAGGLASRTMGASEAGSVPSYLGLGTPGPYQGPACPKPPRVAAMCLHTKWS